MSRVARYAAALILLLVALFPAAAHAARPPLANAGNTGPRVPCTPTGVTVISTPGTYSALCFTGFVTVTADDVTITDSTFEQGLQFNATDRQQITYSLIVGGLSLSSTLITNVSYTEIRGGEDLMHLTGDRGRPVVDTVVDTVWAHSPTPQCGDHSDGMQVRGAQALSLVAVNIDMGAWRQVCGLDVLNAAVYLENANGGNSDIDVQFSKLNGGGYTFRRQLVTGSLTIADTTFGQRWQYGQQYATVPPPPATSISNVQVNKDGTRSPLVIQ